MPSISSICAQHHMLWTAALKTRESFGAEAQYLLQWVDDKENLKVGKLAMDYTCHPHRCRLQGDIMALEILVELTFIPYSIPYV